MNIVERIHALIQSRKGAAGRVALRKARDLEDDDSPWWLRILSRPQGTMAQRRPMPILKCPNGHRFAVAGGHSVEASGDVNPRVKCPECDWVALVQLDGWEA